MIVLLMSRQAMRSKQSLQTPDRSFVSRLNLHRQVLVQQLLQAPQEAALALGAQQLP